MRAKIRFNKLFTCSSYRNEIELRTRFHAPLFDRKQVCRLENSLT